MDNDTQVCDLSWNKPQEEEDDAIQCENSNPVAVFAINNQKLLIYPGKRYTIGRGVAASLVVPVKSLSKQHIAIEYDSGAHQIQDLNSKNKTRRGQLVLKPGMMYELPDMTHSTYSLLLGETSATYHYIHDKTRRDWLDVSSERLPACSSTPAKTVRIRDEVQALEISADGGSSDAEGVPASQFIPQLDESSVLYVEESPQNSPLKRSPATARQQVPETPGPKTQDNKHVLNVTEDLGQDTSLLNTIKELRTLVKLQGEEQPTTVPDSQYPNIALDEGSECGSEIVDLNQHSESGDPVKIAETQVNQESDDEEEPRVGGDDTNTQCWDITIPPDEDEGGEETEKTAEEATETAEESTETVDGAGDDKKIEVTKEEDEGVRRKNKAAPEPGTVAEQQGNGGNAGQEQQAPTTARKLTKSSETSDMEITCVDGSQTGEQAAKPDGEISMLSVGSGAFSPTAVPTQVEYDSDATDIEEPVGGGADKEPEESLIESPVMSESEIENSVDRRDKYRRSLVRSMAEDSQLWENIMSQAVSEEEEHNIVKTPPRQNFAEDIVRTPPRSVAERPNNIADPVITPTKCEIEHGEERMVDVSEDKIDMGEEEEVEGTQTIPDIPDAEEVEEAQRLQEIESNDVEEIEAEGTQELPDIEDNETQEIEELPDVESKKAQEIEKIEIPAIESKKAQEIEGTAHDIPESKVQEVVELVEEERDSVEECSVIIVELEETEPQVVEPRVVEPQVVEPQVVEPQIPILFEDDTASEDDKDMQGSEKSESDEEDLRITSVQDACSVEITHVREDDYSVIEDTPCTLELDVKFCGGTDDFDVLESIKDEPNTQETKAFLSMFEPDEGDMPDPESQLLSLPFDIAEKSEVKKSVTPVKRGRARKADKPSPAKNVSGKAGKGRKPAGKEKAKPPPKGKEKAKPPEKAKPLARGRRKKIVESSEDEKEEEEEEEEEEVVVAPTKKAVVVAPSTILKLDSVEELLRKRREAKQKQQAKAASTKTKAVKKKAKPVLEDDDELPDFGGLMDGSDSDNDSDEVVELDLLTTFSPPKPRPKKEAVQQEPPKVTGNRKRKASDPVPVASKKEKIEPARPSRQKRLLSDSEDSVCPEESIRTLRRHDSTDTQDSMTSTRSTRGGSRRKAQEAMVEEPCFSPPKRGRRTAVKPAVVDDEDSLPPKRRGKAKIDSEDEVSEPPTPIKRSRKAVAPEVPSTPDASKRGSKIAAINESPVIGRRGRKTSNSTVEASPLPTVSKRGRLRKTKSDVRKFLAESKIEIEAKGIEAKPKRGGKGAAKKDAVDEVVKSEAKPRRATRGVKKEVIAKAEVYKEEDKSPVITVGRGKRKKTTSPLIKKENVRPSAAIVNANYKKENVASPSRRATMVQKPEIVYTGLVMSASMKKAIASLNGVVSDDITSCTHLVTDKIKRTAKFLCAIGRGIPIVQEGWLTQSKACKGFVDPVDYFIKDKSTEKQYNFVLTKSLERARQSPFLSGYNVYITKTCKPDPKQFEPIISCNGGEVLKKVPKASDHNVIILATKDDNLATLSRIGAPVCSTELVLTGALRQQLCITEFSLREKSPEL